MSRATAVLIGICFDSGRETAGEGGCKNFVGEGRKLAKPVGEGWPGKERGEAEGEGAGEREVRRRGRASRGKRGEAEEEGWPGKER